ncbi:MAG: hypothetical protein OQK24_06295 [Magnetovibrio sp.]|nr:hypothetical protein [Magnetovibrio sp.]
MFKQPKHISTGESQISINKKWVVIIIAIVVVFVVGVGGMFHYTAVSRPPTEQTGGYK